MAAGQAGMDKGCFPAEVPRVLKGHRPTGAGSPRAPEILLAAQEHAMSASREAL